MKADSDEFRKSQKFHIKRKLRANTGIRQILGIAFAIKDKQTAQPKVLEGDHNSQQG